MFNPNAKPENQDRELIPEGPHLARCARVIEIGKHLSGFPPEDGKEEYPKDKVVIVFALPNVIMNFGETLGDKQAFISRPFGITMSTGEKAIMRQYSKALDPQGQATSLGWFIDQPCQISVVHKPRKDKPPVAIIDSVAPCLPGLEVPALDTQPFWFKWNDPDGDTLQLVPPFTRELMTQAVNYPDSRVQQLMEQLDQKPDEADEDLPF